MKPIIDVSKHNGAVNWELIKDQIEGAIIRIGYRGYGSAGNIVEDPQFQRNDSECYYYGIPREYYYFPTDLTVSECAESAIWICYLLRAYKDLPITIWLDSEKAAPTGVTGRSDNMRYDKRTNMLLTLRDFIKTLYPSWEVGIYCAYYWLRGNLDEVMIRENNVPLRLTRYNKIPGLDWYRYWQYSNNGALKGVDGCFDFNVRNGEEID